MTNELEVIEKGLVAGAELSERLAASAALVTVREQVAEMERLNRQAICVYCGHVGEGATRQNLREIMAAHITDCEKHPINRIVEIVGPLEQQIAALTQERNEAIGGAKLYARSCQLGQETAEARVTQLEGVLRDIADGARVEDPANPGYLARTEMGRIARAALSARAESSEYETRCAYTNPPHDGPCPAPQPEAPLSPGDTMRRVRDERIAQIRASLKGLQSAMDQQYSMGCESLFKTWSTWVATAICALAIPGDPDPQSSGPLSPGERSEILAVLEPFARVWNNRPTLDVAKPFTVNVEVTEYGSFADAAAFHARLSASPEPAASMCDMATHESRPSVVDYCVFTPEPCKCCLECYTRCVEQRAEYAEPAVKDCLTGGEPSAEEMQDLILRFAMKERG